MLFSFGKNRRELERIASSIRFSFSQSEFELVERFRGLEKLLFYRPDQVTKELHFDFYFSIEELLRSIESSIRDVIARHLYYLIAGKEKSLLKKDGALRWPARRLVLKPLYHLPPPSYRRIKKRLKYLRINLFALQEDHIRLQKITRVLFDKGYLISQEPVPYYKSIDFFDLLGHYLNRRYSEDFIKAVLIDLGVIEIHYHPKTGPGSAVRPIVYDKKMARLRKTLSQSLNDYAQKLDNDKKRDFVQQLLNREIDETNGRKAIKELAVLLRRMPFEEAKKKVLAMDFMKKLPDTLLSENYEIGPKGILRKN